MKFLLILLIFPEVNQFLYQQDEYLKQQGYKMEVLHPYPNQQQ
jgi:hypothetical protein